LSKHLQKKWRPKNKVDATKKKVDLQQEEDAQQDGYLSNHLQQHLTRASQEEDRMNYQVWKSAQLECVVREKRDRRMRDYEVRKGIIKFVRGL
jgi:hypothetical protein